MSKTIQIYNKLYKKRLLCALLEMDSYAWRSNPICDDIVQKWMKADEDTLNERLKGVMGASIKIDIYTKKDYKKTK